MEKFNEISGDILASQAMEKFNEIFGSIIAEPFVWGLLVGLVLVVLMWRSMRKDKVHLRGEIARLRVEADGLTKHLNTQLKINAKGNEALEKQLDKLKDQNENLRVTLSAAQQKPGKAEMRRLDVMEAAVTSMRESAPGFAQAWERAMRDSEIEQGEVEGGFRKLIRKVVPSFRSTTPALEHNPDSDDDGSK